MVATTATEADPRMCPNHLTLCTHKAVKEELTSETRAQVRGSHTREDARKLRHSQETSSNWKPFQK